MADATFLLEILTPSHREFSGQVHSVVAPGLEGYLGVLAHHAPLITPLAPGRLTVQDPAGSRQHYYVSGGFLEVSGNRAIVLADTLEAASEIDPAEAAAEVAAASAARKAVVAPPDVAAAEQALAQARARLRTARREKGE
jgi:F-type H+-transporting ATPase subunit epsilon